MLFIIKFNCFNANCVVNLLKIFRRMTDKEYSKAIVTIGKEELSTLPPAVFPGKIVVVNKVDQVAEAIKDLKQASVIGFDTETRPSFKKGQSYNVSLVQLATPDTTYLFRTNMIGFPESLIKIFEDPAILKVGLSIHDDFHNLHRVIEFDPQGFIDLQSYVKDYKIADNSLSRVYGILFGKRISKGQRLTNWEASVLTETQREYAALDAYACIEIYEYLNKGKFHPNKSPYLTLPPEPAENEN